VPETSGAEEDDQMREARAYNSSIYLMVAMPYATLGVFGFVVYRGLRRKALADQLPVGAPRPGGAGDSPCSPRSPAEDS
jgi:hypothetical protein